jgi:hypothetical protein
VLLVLQESILLLSLLLMAHVITVMQLAQPALEDFTLNAQFVTLLLLLYQEQNAEECVVRDNIGDLLITHASPVWLLVLIALGLELMTVTAALMDFIYQGQHQIVAQVAT